MHNAAHQKRKGAKSSHRVPATTIASTRWGVAIQITKAKEGCGSIEMFQAWAGRHLKGMQIAELQHTIPSGSKRKDNTICAVRPSEITSRSLHNRPKLAP